MIVNEHVRIIENVLYIAGQLFDMDVALGAGNSVWMIRSTCIL